MPSVDPDSTLGLSLKNCFGDGLYSDLRIKDTNGHEYAVHRVVVCGQSPVLANACKAEHGFKEAQTGVINLEHDHPDAVRDMLEFMYSGSYPINYGHALLQHARAYAIGEIYDVPELKDFAAAEFQDLSSIEWDQVDFTDAVRVIYESIPDRDHGGIRDMASRVIADHYSLLLIKPEFEAVLDDFSAVGKDVLRTLAKAPKRYECIGYTPTKHIVLLSIDHMQPREFTICPHCRIRRSNEDWSFSMLPPEN